ncbi:MAG: class I SAM-dependent methyltransferase [Candidatus Bathyarchaeia archaeon]
MSWKYTDEYYKNYTRETWDECAEKYIPLSRQLVPFHKSLLDLVRPSPGERILDVCTGPGEPAMSIASIIAPSGQVVGVDLSSNMTEIATKTAAKRGLRNVEFVTMDAEKLEFPVNTFDVAVSCFGFQIVTQPEAAAKEIFRVLKPGGRAGFTVWSKGDHAQAIDVLIEPMMEHATPDEDGYLPSPYELGGPGELVNMLKKIGFVNPTEVRTVGNFVADGVEDYLSMVLVGTPLGHSLSEETEEVQKAVRAKAKGNISRYATAKGVSIPTECVIVVASKPA